MVYDVSIFNRKYVFFVFDNDITRSRIAGSDYRHFLSAREIALQAYISLLRFRHCLWTKIWLLQPAKGCSSLPAPCRTIGIKAFSPTRRLLGRYFIDCLTSNEFWRRVMSAEMVFGDFVEDCGRQNNWTDSTYEKFAAVKNHLTNFRKALTFEFFDEQGLNDYVSYLRDVFLFQCFTDLRYSDVFNLRRSDIKGDHIEVTTVKTSDSLIIELNNHSKAILDKYKDVVFENDKVLPVITNQKMNDYLKELAELAEIDEPVRQTYYKGNERIDEVTPKYALLGFPIFL